MMESKIPGSPRSIQSILILNDIAQHARYPVPVYGYAEPVMSRTAGQKKEACITASEADFVGNFSACQNAAWHNKGSSSSFPNSVKGGRQRSQENLLCLSASAFRVSLGEPRCAVNLRLG